MASVRGPRSGHESIRPMTGRHHLIVGQLVPVNAGLSSVLVPGCELDWICLTADGQTGGVSACPTPAGNMAMFPQPVRRRSVDRSIVEDARLPRLRSQRQLAGHYRSMIAEGMLRSSPTCWPMPRAGTGSSAGR
jgi:hypothetical protein